MAYGLSAVNLANPWLNVLRGTTFTGAVGLFAALTVGDPGASGTSNPSAVTTRVAVTLNAAASGAVTLSGTPSWSMTTSETIAGITLWSASTGGTFYDSIQLTTARPVVNTDTLNLNTLSITLATLAA